MRLWSIHPKYLDAKGITALWREALLARKALAGKTKGYKSHPQLDRFRKICAIDAYLREVFNESCRRGYCFDRKKLKNPRLSKKIPVTSGQIEYEFSHLKRKLRKRCAKKYRELLKTKKPLPNPAFCVRKGKVESFERLS